MRLARCPMGRVRAAASLALLGLWLGATDPSRLAAQGPPAKPLAGGTVRGTLMEIDKSLNGLFIRNEAGAKMAWRLDRSVIEQVARFKAGDPVYVIYRELGGGNRAVTAIGFPGSETKPVYVNATGDSVLLRTGPFVNGACRGPRESAQVGRHRLRRDSITEDVAPCWCCSSIENTCEPANRSYEPGDQVTGRIILSRCFP